MEKIEVRGAPNYYVCEDGILENLESLLYSHGFHNCFVITGEKSWKTVDPYFPKNTFLTFSFFKYKGECSISEIQRLSKLCLNYDVIIGIGGGKVLDLAKAVSNQVDLKTILIPTLASTCSAWTPISVIYDDNGKYVRYDIFSQSTFMVLVDTKILLHSPVVYLRSGIADTLAKWYEADCIIRQSDDIPLSVMVAHQTAHLCKKTILKYGETAIEDLLNKRDSIAFRRIIETIIMAGGMVGGFGDRYGRIAGAHSVHNGLTKLPETHHLLHGEKVAYGILVQLALEENLEEIQRLIPFYRKLNLPFTLKHLGLKNINKERLNEMAEEIIKPDESIHLMNISMNSQKIIEAIFKIENLVNKE